MAISKPSWLRSFLDKLNWDILTWKVYVGDAVESAIDWAIDKINIAIDWGEDAWNKAVIAWDKAVDVFWDLTATINREANRLWDNIEVWWDDLGEWWEPKITWIKGLVGIAEDALFSLIKGVEIGLNWLDVQWDNFWENTWPQMKIDFNTLLVNVGNFFTGILPGLASHQEVEEAIEDERSTWKDIVDFVTNFRKEIVAFFTDPIDWLWSKLVDYLEKNW